MEKKIADQKDAEKMERAERKIIKEQGKKGVIVYRYSDFHEEIDESDINFSNLGWRFDIIMEKFKIFLDMFEFNEENMRYGIVLGAIIKDAERELEDISGFIDKSLGGISIVYKEDDRYDNFQDRSVAGLIFQPSSGIPRSAP